MTQAQAKYDFVSDEKDPSQMSLKLGEILSDVREIGNGWSEGTKPSGDRGVFPSSYVDEVTAAAPPPPPPPPAAPQSTKPAPPQKKQEVKEEAKEELTSKTTDRLIPEIEEHVRDWRAKLMTLLNQQKFDDYYKIKNQINTLLEWRRQLLNPRSEHEWIRQQVIKLIESRRQMDEAFTVPRTQDNSVATTDNSTVTDLHEKHKVMEQRMLDGSKLPTSALEQYTLEEDKGIRQRRAAQQGNNEVDSTIAAIPSHLFLSVNTFVFATPDPVQMVFTLYSRADTQRRGSITTLPAGASTNAALGGDDFIAISEEFMVVMTNKGFPEDPELLDRLFTLFADIARSNIRDHLYLAVRVYRMGSIAPSDIKSTSKASPGAMFSCMRPVMDNDIIFRRPFGVGVVDLSTLDLHQRESGKAMEYTMPLVKPVGGEPYTFAALHAALMNNDCLPQEGVSESIPNCNGVVLTLAVVDGAMQKLRETKPALSLTQHNGSVTTIEPFKDGKLAITKKMFDKKLLSASDERNDLYVTLCGGKFNQGKKKSPKNVEVKVIYLANDGTPIDALTRGVGPQALPDSIYRSGVYYHSNNPNFGETVRLAIPPNDAFEKSHLLFIFYHCKDDKKTPRTPGSFAFLPLTSSENGVAISDGDHKLSSYALLSGMDKGNYQPSYLSSASLTQAKTSGLFQRGSTTEEFTVSLRLLSSKKTQIQELHELINWRQIDPSRLQKTLDKLVQSGVSWPDVLKLLGEVLDALVTLLNSKLRGGSFNVKESLPVFFFFSYILENFTREHNKLARPLLEQYVTRQGHTFGKLHSILLKCVDYYLDVVGQSPLPNDVQMKKGLQNTLSSLHYQMRFVLASSQAASLSPADQTELTNGLSSIFTKVIGLMDRDESGLIRQLQHKMLRQMWPVVSHLHALLPEDVLNAKLVDLLDRLHTSYASNEHQYNLDKLLLVRHMVKGFPFDNAGPRRMFLAPLVDLITGHINDGSKEQKDVAIVLINDILHKIQLHRSESEQDFKAGVVTMSQLIPLIIKTATEAMSEASENDDSGESHVAILALKDCHINPSSDSCTALLSLLYLQTLTQDEEVAKSNEQFLGDLIECLSNMLRAHVYQRDWLVMNMLQYEVTINALAFAAKQLNSGVNTEGLDEALFETGLLMLNEEALDLTSKSMSQARRNFIEKVGNYGDLRLKVVPILEARWEKLEQSRRTEMIDLMVKPLLELVDSSSNDVSSMAKEMFFNLLQAEFATTQDFKSVGRHTVDAIDIIINEDIANGETSDTAESSLAEMFRVDLLEKFEKDSSLNIDATKQFLRETTELFSLMRALAIHPKIAAFEDERIYAYTKLMDFLYRLQRYDTYIKYAHTMSKELSALGLHSEAASAVLLHARLLECDTRSRPDGPAVKDGSFVEVAHMLEEALAIDRHCHGDCKGPKAHVMLEELDLGIADFPEQTTMGRRERLYSTAMDLFDRGQQWEMAIELGQALVNQFSRVTFELEKIPPLLRKIADWYEQILKVERFYPSVFRVGYYGQKFPPELRNQEFVYRGAPLEQIIDFTSRIKNKFPKHEMLSAKIAPGQEHMDSTDTYYLQISKLTPATRPEMKDDSVPSFYTDPLLPANLKVWRQNNCVDTFFYTRPFNKRKQMGMPKSSNEFLDLWVEKKFVRTTRPFPSTQRRLLVTEQAAVFRNPIEMALESMVDKNKELEMKITTMETLPDGGADQSYTMALNGVVDAAVNGGVENYRSMIDGTYRTHNQEIAEAIDETPARRRLPWELSQSLEHQIELLDWGVKVHSRKVCEAMKPLGAHMETNYEKLRKALSELLAQGPKEPNE